MLAYESARLGCMQDRQGGSHRSTVGASGTVGCIRISSVGAEDDKSGTWWHAACSKQDPSAATRSTHYSLQHLALPPPPPKPLHSKNQNTSCWQRANP